MQRKGHEVWFCSSRYAEQIKGRKKAEILRGRGGKKELNRKRGIEIKEGQN